MECSIKLLETVAINHSMSLLEMLPMSTGGAEYERPENDGQRKLRDWNLTDWKMTDKVSGLVNDEVTNYRQTLNRI